MLAQRCDALIRIVGIAPENLERRKRQDPLRGLLERAVEDFIHLMAESVSRRHGRDRPKYRYA
jgi:hypothetical protein